MYAPGVSLQCFTEIPREDMRPGILNRILLTGYGNDCGYLQFPGRFIFTLACTITHWRYPMPDTPDDPLLGKPAPLFCLPDADEKKVCLEDMTGKWVVVYFYPRDNTPGCTLEARSFSESADEFTALGAVIIGVSGDSVDSHKKFSDKQNLRFTILSDTAHRVLEAYGVWKEKKLFGAIGLGTERSTFLVDPKGTVAAVWRKVKVVGHVDDVKNRVRELSGKD